MRGLVAQLCAAAAALALSSCSFGSGSVLEPEQPAKSRLESPAASAPETPRARREDVAKTRPAYPAYRYSVRRIGPALRERMRFSHRSGCPLPVSELRYLRLAFIDFDGVVRRGEMVIHHAHANDVASAFERLYAARWPIQQMRLVDDFEGDDDRSMAANNTSGYNCRRATGQASWSEHAYGGAIDINPVQNPYVMGSSIVPPQGRQFALVDRRGARAPEGVIRAGGAVVSAFASIGWKWGGHWSQFKDYQHFSATGR